MLLKTELPSGVQILRDLGRGLDYFQPPMRQYTPWETAVANLPYAAMVLLGSLTVALSLWPGPWALAGGVAYALGGVGGALWIMVWVCPHCHYYDTRGCPCGYGVIAARLVRKGAQECFAQKFKRHIPVIVPLWVIPVLVGLVALAESFRWGLLVLVLVFVLDAYVVLPLVSKRHSCAECPQREGCPWMAHC